MKTLAIAVFTMATGCVIDGKSMFTGPQAPATAPATSAPAASHHVPAPVAVPRSRQKVERFVRVLENLVGDEPQWDAFEHERCTLDYQELLELGVSPSTTVSVKGRTGTLEAFEQELCTNPVVARDQREEQEAAARRAARKAEQDRRDGKTQ